MVLFNVSLHNYPTRVDIMFSDIELDTMDSD